MDTDRKKWANVTTALLECRKMVVTFYIGHSKLGEYECESHTMPTVALLLELVTERQFLPVDITRDYERWIRADQKIEIALYKQ